MKSFLLVLVLIISTLGNAQVKIGDTPQTLDEASLLELESTSKVLVISRISEAQMLALSPLPGAMVYNIDASCIFYYNGTNWNNLCTDNSWGAISGNITAQADLAAEFQNYVNLTSPQSIAGEKTLTEKFTVNTGTTTDQIAEFLGRVKGENGTAPEDFVTKAQLDASAGASGTTGSIFFADDATGATTEDNANLFWDNTNKRLGIGTSAPNSPVHIAGAITLPITFGQTGLNETHHTTLIDFDVTVFLPPADSCTGRIYVIKKRPAFTVDIQGGYFDSDYDFQTTMQENVIQIQSDGFNWQQIN